jgi:hypothetical protein
MDAGPAAFAAYGSSIEPDGISAKRINERATTDAPWCLRRCTTADERTELASMRARRCKARKEQKNRFVGTIV